MGANPRSPETGENTMTEAELETVKVHELSPLQIFFAKVGAVTAAILIILYAAGYFLSSFIESTAEPLQVLKGGPAFWGTVEHKLYRLADEPDLPPEKKKKIVDALRRLSNKYKPYFEALGGDVSPGESKNR
jgi:hypothetical protein